jgi:serine/threonine protein kinase/GGDEF domain-containing protein
MVNVALNVDRSYQPAKPADEPQGQVPQGPEASSQRVAQPQQRYVPNIQPPTTLRELARTSESSFKLDRTGSLSTDAYGFYTQQMLAGGRSVNWVVFNISGLKHINDTVSHKAGDHYLEAVNKVIREAAAVNGIPAEEIVIVRKGPNFALLAPNAATARALCRLKVAKQFGFTYQGQPVKLSADNLGKKSLINPGILTYEAAELAPDGRVLISESAIKRGLGEEIYHLGRPEADAGRFDREFKIGREEMGRLETFDPSFRLPGYAATRAELAPVLAPADSRNIEVHSGLRNNAQLNADAAALLKDGKAVRFAFFDGNAVGAFRSHGFVGETMMDAIVEVRIAEAAQKAGLPDKGIKLYRHGSGSEEFYLLADEAVPQATMQQGVTDLMKALNDTPFELRLETKQLRETDLGRQYLSENPRAACETINGVEYTTVDLTRITRGRAGVFHRGLTITAGFGTIQPPPATTANVDVYFDQEKAVLMEHGEAAKKLNPGRRNMLVEVGFESNKPFGSVIPLEPAVANPRPIAGQDSGEIDRISQTGARLKFTVEGDRVVYNQEPTSPDDLIGREINGYLVERKIGEGGMGSVFQARPAGDPGGPIIALKVASNDKEAFLKEEEDFLKELPETDRVPQRLGSGSYKGFSYLGMTYMPGEPLARVMSQLSLPEMLAVSSDLYGTLIQLADRNIIHHDVHPFNINVQKMADGSWRAYLLDFGTAEKMTGKPPLYLLGAPGYMAPEHLKGQPSTKTTDGFGVGVLLAKKTTGEYPFKFKQDPDSDRPRKIPDHKALPEEYFEQFTPVLRALLPKILELDPAKRLSLAEAKQQIDRWQAKFKLLDTEFQSGVRRMSNQEFADLMEDAGLSRRQATKLKAAVDKYSLRELRAGMGGAVAGLLTMTVINKLINRIFPNLDPNARLLMSVVVGSGTNEAIGLATGLSSQKFAAGINKLVTKVKYKKAAVETVKDLASAVARTKAATAVMVAKSVGLGLKKGLGGMGAGTLTIAGWNTLMDSLGVKNSYVREGGAIGACVAPNLAGIAIKYAAAKGITGATAFSRLLASGAFGTAARVANVAGWAALGGELAIGVIERRMFKEGERDRYANLGYAKSVLEEAKALWKNSKSGSMVRLGVSAGDSLVGSFMDAMVPQGYIDQVAKRDDGAIADFTDEIGKGVFLAFVQGGSSKEVRTYLTNYLKEAVSTPEAKQYFTQIQALIRFKHGKNMTSGQKLIAGLDVANLDKLDDAQFDKLAEDLSLATTLNGVYVKAQLRHAAAAIEAGIPQS